MTPQKDLSEKVSTRSTKQELWEAYNQLLAETEKEPVKFVLDEKEITSPGALKNLSDLKLKIGQQLDLAGEDLLKDLNGLYETRSTIIQEKRRLIEHFEEQKTALENEIAQVKEQWKNQERILKAQFEEEARQKELARRREDDEYQFSLEVQRRKEADEYARRQQALKEREDEIAQMEKELAATPSHINEEVNKAKAALAKELTDKYNLELREGKLDFERDKKIYELKIANLETRVKSQNEEIAKLQNQLAKASDQVKDIAISVVEGRSLKTPAEQSGEKEK